MAKYLLPCSCGQKTPIEPRQAGEVLACRCGAKLEVPTMREMVSLELADPATVGQAKQRSWGTRERLVLLGVVIILISVGPTVYLFYSRPIPPRRDFNPEAIRRETHALSPVFSWQLYRSLKQEGLSRDPLPEDAAYAELLLRHRIFEGIALLIICAGVAVVVVAMAKKQWATPSRQDS